MSIDLYARYVKDREGIETIIKENGFVTYKLTEGACLLVDIYVSEDAREKGLARKLVSEVCAQARGAGCSRVFANVFMADKHRTETLIAAFKIGFEIFGSHSDRIVIVKNV